MSDPDTALRHLAQAHGVHTEFFDLHGTHHPASPDTLRALLGAVGVDGYDPGQIADRYDALRAEQAQKITADEHVLVRGQTNDIEVRTPCEWSVVAESGSLIAEGKTDATIELPALDIGYYHLHIAAQGVTQTARILVRPLRAPKLGGKVWGMTGALYGLRSNTNGGLGNYADLGQACEASAQSGAQFFGINPIHALGWAAGEMISPYSPTHRGFLNIDHIATAGLGATPDAELIDYDAFRTTHRAALEAEFAKADSFAFKTWLDAQDDDLLTFAQYEAISETHGSDTRNWPAALQTSSAAALAEAGPRTQFHAWLQWRAQIQLADAQANACDAGMGLGLYLDLAVGPRPGGAEVWMNQDTIAQGVTIGAPPDHLSPEGQSWTLAAHAPGPLADSFYAPLRTMLRKLMANCGLLRIDHALGLLRSFWLPDDGSPGGYISQPFEALLAVIAIEAERAGCLVVGEDLGLVPDGFREKMNDAGLYSYSVWQFEGQYDGTIKSPRDLAPDSLACFGTHDTPTLQGFWHGSDVDWWQNVGWLDGSAALDRHAHRAKQRASLRQLCRIDLLADTTEIGTAIQHRLATAPSAMLAVQLDDALGLIDAQNLPGTIDEHPNWRRRLPISVDDLAGNADIQRIDATMPADRRSHPQKPNAKRTA